MAWKRRTKVPLRVSLTVLAVPRKVIDGRAAGAGVGVAAGGGGGTTVAAGVAAIVIGSVRAIAPPTALTANCTEAPGVRPSMASERASGPAVSVRPPPVTV